MWVNKCLCGTKINISNHSPRLQERITPVLICALQHYLRLSDSNPTKKHPRQSVSSVSIRVLFLHPLQIHQNIPPRQSASSVHIRILFILFFICPNLLQIRQNIPPRQSVSSVHIRVLFLLFLNFRSRRYREIPGSVDQCLTLSAT
jgi:hypothetical protein